jgi:hypothetical protein
MITSLSHKYYRTIGQPWLVISIETGSDAVARAMMSLPSGAYSCASAFTVKRNSVPSVREAASTEKYCTQQK